MTPIQTALQLATYVAFFALVAAVWRSTRRRKKPMDAVPDGPPDEPYRVYTKEFDCDIAGRDLDRKLIPASPDYARGWLKLGKDEWRNQIAIADQLANEHRAVFQEALGNSASFEGQAITLLVDQSGSMRDERMRWVAVACRLAAEILPMHGCEFEILGFSTAGWQGGFAYEKWKANRRPKRPGRLCALLHVTYKSFGQQSLERADWEAMLNPHALRENVDGEALEWASNRLRGCGAPKKHLIVLSDGAPVDDVTLMHNGLGYLARHLRQVISKLESDQELDLSAIGIQHAVSEYYQRSTAIEKLEALPKVMAEWLKSVRQESQA